VDRQQRDDVQQWMVRLADGDRAAFAPLYAALWPLVRRFAARALGGGAEADDAAQAALMKIFARASEFDVAGDALRWVLGTAAYECKTLRQKQLRRREDAGVELDRASAEPSPEDTAIARDLQAAALEALGELRPRDIETLQAVMQGTRPDVPSATFRKRLERALERLRSVWSSRHGLD
jgi:RNA polymerase sigma-70 factor, ECF subfamily